MNLLQFIEYQTSTTTTYGEIDGKKVTTQFKVYKFIYIDKNGQKYNRLYTNIPLSQIEDPVIVENTIKKYTRNISLDEYEDMLYGQSTDNAK